MAKRRRRSPVKTAVQYRSGDICIDYVDRVASELPSELARVQQHVRDAIRTLSTLRHVRHIIIVSARFQLRHCLKPMPEAVTPQELADEIARLSFIMEDTVSLLNRLRHCRVGNLEKARFILTYGQTPKKRELTARYGNGGKQTEEQDGETVEQDEPDENEA